MWATALRGMSLRLSLIIYTKYSNGLGHIHTRGRSMWKNRKVSGQRGGQRILYQWDQTRGEAVGMYPELLRIKSSRLVPGCLAMLHLGNLRHLTECSNFTANFALIKPIPPFSQPRNIDATWWWIMDHQAANLRPAALPVLTVWVSDGSGCLAWPQLQSAGCSGWR